jgi:hypothetical protein
LESDRFFEEISSFQDFTAMEMEGTMLGMRENEKKAVKEKIELLKAAYKDPFDILFETIMEKEKKAMLN